jgi:hypothetical protein
LLVHIIYPVYIADKALTTPDIIASGFGGQPGT